MTMHIAQHDFDVSAFAPEKRRRNWTNAEKASIVRQTYQPGSSVSVTARQHGVATSMLFRWRKMERNGQLQDPTDAANLVPVTELLAAREQIAALQRALGAMTMEIQLRTLENQHLRKAMGVAPVRGWGPEAVERLRDASGAMASLWTGQSNPA